VVTPTVQDRKEENWIVMSKTRCGSRSEGAVEKEQEKVEVLYVDSVVVPHRKVMYRFSSHEISKAQNRSSLGKESLFGFRRNERNKTSITSNHCGGTKPKPMHLKSYSDNY
jgi:hypothetical protein